MKVKLIGYFDRNFGDEYMMKAVADALPRVEFFVENNGEITDVIYNCNNITVSEEPVFCEKTLKITGSGFMINSKEAFITELIRFLKRKKDADFCINCNIEPFKNKIYELLMAHKLNGYSMISCRDSYSYEWLEKHTKKPVIKCFPDLVFSIDCPTEKRGDKLGISLMHRAGDTPKCEYYRKMASVADWWIENTGKEIILIAFDTGKEDDMYACRCVQALIKNKGKVKFAAHNNEGDIIKAFSLCDKIIGARFHSIVLALKMGIAIYPVIYREKAKNLLEDVRYPIKGSRIDSLDEEGIKKFLLNKNEEFQIDNKIILTSSEHINLVKEALNEGRD